jgi:hypothetical protein
MKKNTKGVGNVKACRHVIGNSGCCIYCNSTDDLLTDKQRRLLDFMVEGIRITPTFADMKIYMGVTSNQTLLDHLSAIVKKGYALPPRRRWSPPKKTKEN